MPSRRFPFVQVDVFASRALEGNPLAVFTDARRLSDAEMQAVAREMNLSETTFILPRDAAVESAQGVRVRIFTVEEELPFAGHPTLGTARVVHRQTGSAEVRLQLGVGTIPVTFRDGAEGPLGEMVQRDPDFGAVHRAPQIAQATGLPLDAIATDVPAQTVSTGIPFTIVPLRDLQIIRNLRFDLSRAADYLKARHGGFFYFITRETVDPAAQLHARMIFYGGEDPATGSGAGCCVSWAVAHGIIASNQSAIIEQGVECRRPSRIFVSAERSGDRIINVRVGGYSVEVARGEISL